MSQSVFNLQHAHDHQLLLEELEDLRHRIAEAKRATDERKSLFLRELNKLRLERDTLLSRVERLEDELRRAQQVSIAVTEQQQKARQLKRGLAATGGIATATGVLSLAVLLKNTLQLGRARGGWFRTRTA